MKHFETPGLASHEGPFELPGVEGLGKQKVGKMAHTLGIDAKILKKVMSGGQAGADDDQARKELKKLHITEDKERLQSQKQFREMGPIQGGRRGDVKFRNSHTGVGDPRPADFQN